jgi:quercetin dioxygenase-like cupin family protein
MTPPVLDSQTSSPLFLKRAGAEWEELGGGLQRQVLGYDASIMMVRVRFSEEGAVGALHHHPHRQTTLVESGRFEVEIDGEKQVLEAGDGFYIPPNVVHGVVALEPGVLTDVFTPAREDFLPGRVG